MDRQSVVKPEERPVFPTLDRMAVAILNCDDIWEYRIHRFLRFSLLLDRMSD